MNTTRRAPRRRSSFVLVALVVAALAVACTSDDGADDTTTSTTAAPTTTSDASTTTAVGTVDSSRTTDLVLDPEGDYGDEYADGVLPVGDGRYRLDTPETGFVYLCNEGDADSGGADERGPWFINDDTEYDIDLKPPVEGEVFWDGTYSVEVDGDVRRITTNDVPDDHSTGVFPIAADDPAYEYDRNPNAIEEQDLSYELAVSPEVLAEPSCMAGESGIMNTGVALFNAFDAGNRDAGAWEVQDSCDGHPQIAGEYHYHTLSSCIDDISVETIIGWALDGFPITGPVVSDGNILNTDDLDECHGITSTLEIDGESVTTYHYVMTQDFPYSVSCFRGAPQQAPQVAGGAGPSGAPSR